MSKWGIDVDVWSTLWWLSQEMGFYNDETNNFMRIGICGLELELEVIDGNHPYTYIYILWYNGI